MTSSKRGPSPGYLARQARKRGDIDYLVELLSNTEWLARVSAAQELGKLGDPAAVPALMRCLNVSDPILKLSALKALGRIGDPRAAPDVFAIAEDSNEALYARSVAAEIALRLGERGGLLVIASLLSERPKPRTSRRDLPSPHARKLRRWALGLIREFDGVEAIPSLERAMSYAGPLGRYQISRLIRNLQ